MSRVDRPERVRPFNLSSSVTWRARRTPRHPNSAPESDAARERRTSAASRSRMSTPASDAGAASLVRARAELSGASQYTTRRLLGPESKVAIALGHAASRIRFCSGLWTLLCLARTGDTESGLRDERGSRKAERLGNQRPPTT
jgi:hypothetical protein